MMSSQRRNNEQQAVFTRQANILRKNLSEWDRMLRTPRGEDWPKMLGRLNAAFSQTGNLDNSIDDVLEHFVYLPKQSTANPQDIPFFLSTRLVEPNTTSGDETPMDNEVMTQTVDPVQMLIKYENRATQLANEYAENMIRF
jgi:hypothetical protein